MSTDSEALLRILVDAGVEFIVIGGAAAIAHGAATRKDKVVEAELRAIADLRREEGEGR